MEESAHPKLRTHTSDMASPDALPDSTQDLDESLPNLTAAAAEDEEPTSSPASPEQEVVDVESYQPCVVDLTCEDEDEVDVVEVVSQEQPVIYLGTEQRRISSRRRNTSDNNAPPEVEDLTRPERYSAIDDSNDDSNNNAISAERQQNQWNFEPPAVDFHNPNLLFGNLLEDLPVATVDDHNPRPRPNLFMPRLPREMRLSTRRQRSRSRSPQLPDYPRDAPRTPEFLRDLDELMTEVESRMPPPRILGQAENSLSANQLIAQEHSNRVAQMTVPQAPPSPPPPEQPTISCLVCLDSLATIQNTSRTLCSTVCGHVFCSACIEEVVKQRKQCPVCRKKLTKKQYHPLFI
ncbi:uncharacterized protein LOC121862861 isoform X2 [Homarus americanus]|uniref:uncharacterized protein LOC121862861 isoform X2 n=1 Tax=Homarus americanus TaxID=6706 RepID=UPI001C492621|nr:uncharacterized protein LOC121862861 isoform X2 [Homarus americanus]